jgi:hypothetical protein
MDIVSRIKATPERELTGEQLWPLLHGVLTDPTTRPSPSRWLKLYIHFEGSNYPLFKKSIKVPIWDRSVSFIRFAFRDLGTNADVEVSNPVVEPVMMSMQEAQSLLLTLLTLPCLDMVDGTLFKLENGSWQEDRRFWLWAKQFDVRELLRLQPTGRMTYKQCEEAMDLLAAGVAKLSYGINRNVYCSEDPDFVSLRASLLSRLRSFADLCLNPAAYEKRYLSKDVAYLKSGIRSRKRPISSRRRTRKSTP